MAMAFVYDYGGTDREVLPVASGRARSTSPRRWPASTAFKKFFDTGLSREQVDDRDEAVALSTCFAQGQAASMIGKFVVQLLDGRQLQERHKPSS